MADNVIGGSISRTGEGARDEAAFERVRLEAEGVGARDDAPEDGGGRSTLGNDGAGTLDTDPAVVRLADLPAGDSDAPNADAASGDAYVDFSGGSTGSGEFVEFTVTVPAAGTYDLAVGYALSTGSDGAERSRDMSLSVNGAVWDRMFDLSSTGAEFSEYGESETRVTLAEGANTIRLRSNGGSGPNVDYLEARPASDDLVVFQAEELAATDATGGNKAVDPARAEADGDTFRVGAEGVAYLDWAGAGANADMPVTASAGTYEMSVTYANGSSAGRPLDVVAVAPDGTETVLGTFDFAPTDAPSHYPDDTDPLAAVLPPENQRPSGWEGWTAETLQFDLPAGDVVLSLRTPDGARTGPNIDHIDVRLTAIAGTPPTALTLEGTEVPENAPGAVVGLLAVEDADGDEPTFTVDDGRFEVVDGQLKLLDDASLDFETEPTVTVTVTATDDDGEIARTFEIGVTNDTADDPAPEVDGTPVTFDPDAAPGEAGAIAGYAGLQDRPFADGPALAVSDDGTALTLANNQWKRVALPEGYTITADTRLVLDVAVGEAVPEVIAVGYDGDENPFDGDPRIFQIGGTDRLAPFEELRGTGTDNGDGTVRHTIALGADAGQVIDSLLFIADDDRAGDGIGSATFANVRLVEGDPGAGAPTNAAPTATGEPIEPLPARVGENVEGIALDTFADRFTDADGDALTLSVENLPAGLTLNTEGVIVGRPTASGQQVATIRATDPSGASATLDLPFDVAPLEGANAAPTFDAPEPVALTLAEGQTLPALDVAATDADGDALTYALDGPDAAAFTIDAATGAVAFADPLPAPAGEAYAFAVVASDGTAEARKAFTVAVEAAANTPPAFDAPGALSLTVAEGEALPAIDTGASDPDNDDLTFSLDGPDAAAFTLDAGTVAFADPLPAPANGATYEFAITVSDGTDSASRPVSVTVEAADDAGTEPIVIQAEDEAQVAVTDLGAPNGSGSNVTREVNEAAPDAFGNYRVGAEGEAYIDFGTEAGDALGFTVDAAEAGTYTASIRYANGSAETRPLALSVNGGAATNVDFTPTPAPSAELSGWEGWTEIEVPVVLEAGANTVSLAIPDAANGGVANGPNIDRISFARVADDGGDAGGEDGGGTDEPAPFSATVPGETFAITDADGDTVVRSPANPETGANAQNSGPGLAFTADGVRPGASGDAYLDMGGDAGDAASFDVEVPEAGTYDLAVRYANGGSADRPMTLTVGGETLTVPFASTATDAPDMGWGNWQTVTVPVTLAAGANTLTLANVGTAGPNIDEVTLSRGEVDGGTDDPVAEPGPRETIRVNFQDGAVSNVQGYIAGEFVGYSERNGQTYGFVTEASAIDPARGADDAATPIDGADYPAVAINERQTPGVDPRLQGYAHFDLRTSYPAGEGNRVAWELAVPDGTYEVTVSVGDTGGPNDSENRLFIEGEEATAFVPTDLYKSQLVTRTVAVTDGELTLSAQGGTVTEMQYVEVRALPDLTPIDANAPEADYAKFVEAIAVARQGDQVSEVALDPGVGVRPEGVDPAADIILGIEVVPGRGGVLLDSLSDGSIQLYETLTGAPVAFDANTTGGFDAVTISPTGLLKDNTSYTLDIDGFRDRGPIANDEAETREFQRYTTTFVTGEAAEVEAREVAFAETVEVDGFADGGIAMTSVELSPDGSRLYASSITGQITRWDRGADGSLSNAQVLALDYFNANAPQGAEGADAARGIIGLTFDPTDPQTLWVTDNYQIPLTGRDNGVPEFSGRVSKLTLGAGDDFTATAETYITGLPRSNGDHVTNSLEFRANPDADGPSHLLYLIQGSNSAMGAPDSAWGQRPERLLNASVMEIDPTRTPPPGGFDVSTEPIPDDGLNRRFADPDSDLKNGPIPIDSGEFAGNFLVFAANGTATVQDAGGNTVGAFYDPFADDAVLKIFATGQRNAYDLVWHSNGFLYVPTNGSAAGGNTPDDPDTPENEGLNNVTKQDDYLFRVTEGGYYGHPNPLRDEFILNGGNPTGGNDPNEVAPEGNRAGYAPGQAPEANYDVEGSYSLGENRSPNGATEYTGGAFGASLQNALIFTEYSGGNDLRAVLFNADGTVREDFVLRNQDGEVIEYVDPLDVIEDPATGQLYVLTLNRGTGASQIVRLDPAPGGEVDGGDGTGDPTDPGTDPDGPDALDGLVSFATVQAEAGIVGGGTAVRDQNNPEPSGTLRPGATGPQSGYVDFGSTADDFVEWTVDVGEADAGPVTLALRYANGGAADRPLAVLVDGEARGTVPFVSTRPPGGDTDAGFDTWETALFETTLDTGTRTIRLEVPAGATPTGPNIDRLDLYRPEGENAPDERGVLIDGVAFDAYEAENATLDGAVVVPTAADDRNALGTGFVDFDGAGDQSITWTVDAAEAGDYAIAVRYALAADKDARPLGLTVNGGDAGTLPFVGRSGPAEADWFLERTTVTLAAGENTITLTAPGAVGPNVDRLLVGQDAIVAFDPVYAAIDGTGSVDLQDDADSARTLGATAAEFYFTVAESGEYAIDLTAEAGATGGPLALELNGEAVASVPYPADGASRAVLALEAGTDYALRAIAPEGGADRLDAVSFALLPAADPAVRATATSLDAAFRDDRLHFSWIDNPTEPDSGVDRQFKSTASFRLLNEGGGTLEVSSATITGPFALADPAALDGLALGAGESATIEVLFDRDQITPTPDAVSGVRTGRLSLLTNDGTNREIGLDLAGFWQPVDEGGREPNVNEVWEVFGFGNRIEGLSLERGGENSALSTNDVYARTDETEILSPYWRIADGTDGATFTQLAAFHGPGGASFGVHGPGDKSAANDIGLWSHSGVDNQTVLPNVGGADSTAFATATLTRDDIPGGWEGEGLFGMEVAGLSTDPTLNPTGGVTVPGEQQGHTVKVFRALDEAGETIPDTYLVIMDYTGINYDYNDNMYVVTGVTPALPSLEVATPAGSVPDRLTMSRIDNPAGRGVTDTATLTVSNDGVGALEVEAIEVADPDLFAILDGDAEVATLPAFTLEGGESREVTVRYLGTDPANDNAAVLHESSLAIRTGDGAERIIALGGLAQIEPEGGEEPTVQQIVDAFGYTTDVAQAQLNADGLVEANGDEVLAPYFVSADGGPVTITELAVYQRAGDVAEVAIHDPDSRALTTVLSNEASDTQTVLPDAPGGGLATVTFDRNEPFGIRVGVPTRDGFFAWSDPDANVYEDSIGALGDGDVGYEAGEGHLIRAYVARDANGEAIEGTYILAQDYAGVNYDYNDVVMLIENVRPYDPAGNEDADADGVIDGYQTDSDGDGVPDIADDVDDTDDGTDPGGGGGGDTDGGTIAPPPGTFEIGVNFGGGAIASDPVLGVPLVGQDDARVALSGAVNPGAGVDAPSNPNGQGSVAGSAFRTYEDGSAWSAAIAVPDGVYNVALHVQETYWAAAGQRVFDASVNGVQVIDDLDAFAQAGADTPITVVTEVEVRDGQIVIDLDATGPDGVDNAPLSAVTVYRTGDLPDEPDTGDGDGDTAQSPFGGAAPTFTDGTLTVDATDFDEGGQGVAYNDGAGLDGGVAGVRPGREVEYVGSQLDIGYVEPGEWVEYTLEVPRAGTYDLSAIAKTPVSDATIAVSVEDGPVLATLPLADGGAGFGDAPFARTADVPIDLPAGTVTLRLAFDGSRAGNGYVLDLRSFTLVERGDAPVGQRPASPDGTPWAVGDGLELDAVLYDEGGQGVAYSDAAGLDGGTTGGRAGSDVEVTGAGDVGWIRDGEWLEYTIDVPTEGEYALDLLMSLGNGAQNRTVTAQFEREGAFYAGTGSIANTPDVRQWGAFERTDAATVTLEAGVQTVRLTFEGGSQDIRSLRLVPTGATDPGGPTDPEGPTDPGGPVEPTLGPIGESGTLQIGQPNAAAWTAVAFAAPIENAVVVTGPLSTNGGQPATVRVRNVTETGFEVQIDEWDYLDGFHVAETLSWMAVSAGVHRLADGRTVAAGVDRGDGTPDPVDYGTQFDDAPVVLAQVVSTANGGAVVDRVSGVGTDGFTLRLQNEEANAATPLAEDVGWIAIAGGGSSGTGDLVGSTGDRVTQADAAVAWGGAFASQYALLADMQSFDGRDPATVRARSRDADGATLFIEEERSADNEVGHTSETVGYAAFRVGVLDGERMA